MTARSLSVSALLVCSIVAVAGARADAPQNVADYVFLADSKMKVGKDSFIGEGNIGANAAGILLRKRVFTADGSAVAAEKVELGKATSVFDVFAKFFVGEPGEFVIRNAGPMPLVSPLIAALPAPPVFAPGTTEILVKSGRTLDLDPGAYGDVHVARDAVLRLTGGHYELASLKTGKLSHVFVLGPSTINIAGDLKIGHLAAFGPSSPSAGERRLIVNVGGMHVRLSPATHVNMDLLAPSATLRLGQSFHGTGRFMVGTLIAAGRLNLRHPVCGNGRVELGEECDDGNTSDCDGCSASCTTERCGDGHLCGGEECDDGNDVPCDGCTACHVDACGDGVRCGGEACDTPVGCTTCDACAVPICGDGIVCPGEECDDGNLTACDGCTGCALDRCGDGTICASEGETCDPPGTASCDASCHAIADEFCTLEQETYGAADGDANGVAGVVTLHPSVLPVRVGAPGLRSLEVMDQQALACLLPASGTPAALCTGLADCGDFAADACSNPPILDLDPSGDASGGLGGGELTGEVIAAKLNVALGRAGAFPPGLENFLLPTKLCTTRCPEGRELDPNPMKFQKSTAGAADGLNTLGDLIAIADQALAVECAPRTCANVDQAAFAPPNPTSRSTLAHALHAINECFAGCATVIPCAPN